MYIAPSNKPKVKEEGEFGEFVQIRSKRGPESHWHDSPVDENLLGLGKNLNRMLSHDLDFRPC